MTFWRAKVLLWIQYSDLIFSTSSLDSEKCKTDFVQEAEILRR